MKNYKGGYILISLGLIALSTSYAGTIDYDKVSATRKRVVLTDINVGGTKMPDLTVQPIYGNGKITFSDVYGFDIVVKSNNSVEVSEHQAPEDKGVRLYKHHIDYSVSGPGGTSLEFISADAEPFTVTLESTGGSFIGFRLNKQAKFINNLIYVGYLGICKCFGQFIQLLIADESSYEPTAISETDTVTEL